MLLRLATMLERHCRRLLVLLSMFTAYPKFRLRHSLFPESDDSSSSSKNCLPSLSDRLDALLTSLVCEERKGDRRVSLAIFAAPSRLVQEVALAEDMEKAVAVDSEEEAEEVLGAAVEEGDPLIVLVTVTVTVFLLCFRTLDEGFEVEVEEAAALVGAAVLDDDIELDAIVAELELESMVLVALAAAATGEGVCARMLSKAAGTMIVMGMKPSALSSVVSAAAFLGVGLLTLPCIDFVARTGDEDEAPTVEDSSAVDEGTGVDVGATVV